MKQTKKITLLAAAIALCLMLVFSLGGCAQKLATTMIEKAIEKSAAEKGEDVDIDLDEGEVNITDAEGNEMSIGGAEIPEDWPSVVPISNDIELQSSFSQTTDGKKGWTIVGNVNGDAQGLYDYYKNELSGWNEQSDFVSDQGDDGKTYSFQTSNDQYFVVVWIFEKDDEKSITLSVNEQ
ncbi:MAG: hypothetical protein JW997_02325 [Actinobacteria bacterium]|nr:hypothetical protein [Actinomycetota bacterium]